ncbi:MAG: endonuclease [Candidatus Cloacimonetes bacterium]|nr:endonuclease [Candidatus Cloacimonadota bacterium]
MKILLFGLMAATSFASSYKVRLQNFRNTYKIEKLGENTLIPERYKNLQGVKGEELLKQLHELTGKNYKSFDYRSAKKHMYDVVDNKNKKVFTLYSNKYANGSNGQYNESGDANGDGKRRDFVNCEHTWPQSGFRKALPMRSDIHHLYPTFSRANSMRGHMPFGYVGNAKRYSNNLGSKASDIMFEPADVVKGNVARAQFYFYTRYYDYKAGIFQNNDRDEYWTNQIDTLLKWNREDPPDEWEISRNNHIEKYQGNRNPFIDHYQFADLIGRSAFVKDQSNSGSSDNNDSGNDNGSDNGEDQTPDQPPVDDSTSPIGDIDARYEAVKNLKGKELFSALHRLTGENYKGSGYSHSKAFMYSDIDNTDGKVRTLYSSMYFAKGNNTKRYLETKDANGDGTSGDFVNCEHTWPQSMFNKSRPMVSDIHHLYPTLSKPNGMRGRNPFGEINGSKYSTSAGSKSNGKRFEPADEAKGNVARAQFYFYTRYHNKNIFSSGFSKSQYWTKNLPMFLKWHKEDPVDEWEKTRNNRIEKFQGNRNPFIDVPEFADRIGANGFSR